MKKVFYLFLLSVAVFCLYACSTKQPVRTDTLLRSWLFTQDTTTTFENQMVNGKCTSGKVIKDGVLLIEHNNRTYNALGMELK